MLWEMRAGKRRLSARWEDCLLRGVGAGGLWFEERGATGRMDARMCWARAFQTPFPVGGMGVGVGVGVGVAVGVCVWL